MDERPRATRLCELVSCFEKQTKYQNIICFFTGGNEAGEVALHSAV